MTETAKAWKGNDADYPNETEMLQEDQIVGYKLLGYDFADDGVRFEVGKTYDKSESLSLDYRVDGFRFTPITAFDLLNGCTKSLSLESWCLNGKINKNTIRFALVSCDAADLIGAPTDIAHTSKIKIVTEFSFEELVRIGIEHSFYKTSHDIIDNTIRSELVSSENDIRLSSSRYKTIFVTCGDRVKLTSNDGVANFFATGADTEITAYDTKAKIITSGPRPRLTTYGDFSLIAAGGDSADITVKGNYTAINASGDKAKITAVGERCNCAASGKNSFIEIPGGFGTFKGIAGTVVQIASYNSVRERQEDVRAAIGENNVKPDTLYTVRDGKFVEVEAAND